MIRLTLQLLLVATATAVAQPPGFVHGTVVDDTFGAVIQRIAVSISSIDETCDTVTDREGKFSCRLKPGRYRITVSDPDWEAYERSTMELGADAHVFVRLRLVGSSQTGLALEARKPPELASQLLRQRLSLPWGGDVYIQASGKTVQSNETMWEGPHLVITMGAVAIYADRLFCSEPVQTCRGTGNIQLENGKEDLLGDEVEIDLKLRTIKVTRAAIVVRSFE